MIQLFGKKKKGFKLNTILRVAVLFFVFSSVSLMYARPAYASTCNAPANDADVVCRCPKNECRLSMADNYTFWTRPIEIGWSSTGFQYSHQYTCFPANTGETIDIKAAKFAPYSYADYIGKMQLKVNPQDKFPPVAVDALTTNLSKMFVPEGSTCKATDGVAYWYYPLYASKVMNGNGAVGSQCAQGVKPILVEHDLFGKEVVGVDTFFGCLPASVNGLVAFVLRIGLGLGTIVGVLIVLINLIKMVSSATNPDAVSESRKKMVSGIASLVALYLTLTILSIAGLQILDLGSFGGGLLRIFTGG